jgi:hypothetical protein
MRPVILVLAALLGGLPAKADEEPSMPATASVGDRDLVLNGSALRSVWGFRVYEVGLFLGERNGDAAAIMDRDRTPKRVRMNMLRSVEKEKFVATVRENIDQNLSAAEKETFATELAEYIGHLEKGGDIKPGRVITIDFVPGQGTLLGLDGKHVGTIPGDDFYHLMLRLWIGQPLQASIKDGLLGRPD